VSRDLHYCHDLTGSAALLRSDFQRRTRFYRSFRKFGPPGVNALAALEKYGKRLMWNEAVNGINVLMGCRFIRSEVMGNVCNLQAFL
jgi:hypothetical protein